jgi:predicted HTH domain antitoxin
MTIGVRHFQTGIGQGNCTINVIKDNLMLKIQDLVNARLYQNDQAVIQDALRHLCRARPELRIQVAVYRYQTEEISLAKAASLAGVSWAQMKDILKEKGVSPRLGVSTLTEAMEDIQALRQELEGGA